MADYSLGLAVLGTAVDLTGLQQGLQQAQGAAQQAGQDVGKGMATGLDGMREILVGSLRQVGSLITDALVGGVQALAGFGQESLSVAANFESGMNRLASVAGSSLAAAGFSMDDVKAKALELGAVTQFSAAQAQDAMINLAKGGVPIEEIMTTATDATLALAAAGELELGPAAEIVAKQLGVWRETGVQAADVSNLMAQAANASTVDVDELALGLANVGGVARESGVGFQDMVQTMALLSPGFSSAADAGTAFTTFLLNLQPKSNAARDAMAELGLISVDYQGIADDLGVTLDGSQASYAALDEAILKTIDAQAGGARGSKEWKDAYTAFMEDFTVNQFYDASGAMKDMDEVAGLLNTALSGLSEEQKQVALNTIFGSDAFRAAAIIGKAGTEGFNEMGEAMAQAGSAMDQAAIRNKGFQFAWDSLLGSIETVQIILGGAVLPVLTDLVNMALIPAVNMVMEFASALTTAEDPMGFLLASINSVIPGFSTFIGWVGQLITALNPLWSFLSANILPILGGVATAIGYVLAPAIGTAATAALGAVGPFLAMIAPFVAIAAAAAALYIAWNNNFLGIRDIVMNVVTAIVGFVQAGLGQLMAFWQANGTQILATATAIWNQIRTVVSTAIQLVIAVAGPILQTLGSLIVTVFGGIASFIQANSGTIQTILTGAWTYVSNIIRGALTVIQGVITAALQLIQGNWSGAWQTLVNTAVAVWGNMRAAIGGAIQMVVGIIQLAFSPLVAFVTNVWNNITTAIGTALAAVGQRVQAAISPIVSIVQSVFTTVSSAVMTAVNAVLNAVTTAWNAVATVTRTVWSTLVAIVAPVVQSIVQVIQTTLNVVTTIFQAIFNTVVLVVRTAMGLLIAAVGPPLSAMASAISAALNAVVSFLTTAWNNIVTATRAAWAAVVAAVLPPLQSAVSAVSSAGAAALSAISAAWNAVVSVTSSAWSAVVSAVSSFLSAAASVVASVTSAIMSAVSAAWDAILSVTSSIWSAIVSVITAVVDAILSVVTAGWSSAQAETTTAMSSIQAVIDSAWALITTVIQTAVNIVTTVVQTAWAVIVAASQNNFSAIGGIVQNGWNQIVGFFQNGVNQAVAILQNMVGQATSIGGSIIDGIASGISAGAGKLADMARSAVSNALDAAKRALGIASPSQVMAAQVGGPIIDGIMEGISKRSPKLTEQVIELTGKVIDIMGEGAEAFAKVQAMGNISMSAVTKFADMLYETMRYFGQIAQQWDKGMMSAASQFARKAEEVIGQLQAGVELLAGIAELPNITQAAVNNFALGMQMTMNAIIAIATVEMRHGLSAAVEFAQGAGAVVEVIGTAVEGLNALNTFVRPVPGVIQAFTDVLAWLVSRFVLVGQWLNGQALAAAIEFATGAGKVTEILGTAVEGFSALNEWVRPIPGRIQTFTDVLAWLVSRFAEVGLNWLRGEAMAAAVMFAEGAGKVVEVIGAAVDAFSALNEFVRPVPGLIQTFTNVLAWLVSRFAEVGGWMRGQALAGAVAFAEGAKSVIDMVSSGIDALTKLTTFVAPAESATSAFIKSLADLLEKMEVFFGDYEQDVLDALAGFGEGVQSAISFISDAVDALSEIGNLIVPAESAVSAFLRALADLLEKMETLFGDYEQDVLAALSGFGEGMEKAVGFVKNAVDGLGKMLTFVAPSEGTINEFLRAMVTLVKRMSVEFDGISMDLITAMAEFGKGASDAIGFAKKAVDSLEEISGFVAPLEASYDSFFEHLKILLSRLALNFGNYDKQQMAILAAFGDAAEKATDYIKKAAASLEAIAEFVAPTEAAVQGFMDTIRIVMLRLGQIAVEFSSAGIAAAVGFADGAARMIGIIGTGTGFLSMLNGFQAPTDAAVAAFAAVLRSLITQLSTLAASFALDAIKAGASFAEAVGRMLAIIDDGITALDKLSDFKAPLQEAITAFGTAIKAVVTAITQVASSFTVEAVAAAQDFSDGVGKLLDMVKAAITALKSLEKFEALDATVMPTFAASLRSVVGTISTLATEYQTEAMTRAQAFATAALAVVAKVKEGIDAVTMLGQVENQAGQIVTSFVGALTSIITQMTTNTVPAAGEYGKQLVTAVITGVQSTMPGLTAAVQQGLAAVAGMGTQAQAAGAAIAAGIQQGFQSGTSPLLAAMRAVVMQIIAEAQAALQIASPSKVAADMIGLPIVQGMAAGISGHAALVSDAATGAANAAFSAAGKVVYESYNFTANYSRYQDERSLKDDVQMVSMMRGRR